GVLCALLADRYGRRTMISWTIAVYSLGSLLSGLAPSHRALLLARLLTGFGVGGEWASGHALVAETFPPAYRGRAGALFRPGRPPGRGLLLSRSGAYLGVIVAAQLLGYTTFGWVSDHLGRRRTFCLYALLMSAGLLPLAMWWTQAPAGILSAMALVGVGTGTW